MLADLLRPPFGGETPRELHAQLQGGFSAQIARLNIQVQPRSTAHPNINRLARDEKPTDRSGRKFHEHVCLGRIPQAVVGSTHDLCRRGGLLGVNLLDQNIPLERAQIALCTHARVLEATLN